VPAPKGKFLISPHPNCYLLTSITTAGNLAKQDIGNEALASGGGLGRQDHATGDDSADVEGLHGDDVGSRSLIPNCRIDRMAGSPRGEES